MAQHYANNQPQPPEPESSNTTEGPGPIDWSFLDTLDTNTGHVMDFELFDEPNFDMYMPPPHFSDNAYNQDDDRHSDDHENGGGGNVPSFLPLWNF